MALTDPGDVPPTCTGFEGAAGGTRAHPPVQASRSPGPGLQPDGGVRKRQDDRPLHLGGHSPQPQT